MHYKDGTEAKIGDIVKGTGYNVQNPDKTMKVIVGRVVGLTPGTKSCNIQVAHIVTAEISAEMQVEIANQYRLLEIKGTTGGGLVQADNKQNRVIANVSLEYGQCDAFGLVHRE